MNTNDQCNRCGIDRDVHDLRPAPDHAFVEPVNARDAERRDELERLRGELAEARGKLTEVHLVASTVTLKRHGCDPSVLAESLCNVGDFDIIGAREASEMFARIASLVAPPPAESTPLLAMPVAEKPLRRPPGGFLLDEKNRYKPNICPKCLGRKIDRQGRECRYCSWKPQPAPPDDIVERQTVVYVTQGQLDQRMRVVSERLDAMEAKGEPPRCYSTDCRYYGQRHATPHEPGDDEAKGAKP